MNKNKTQLKRAPKHNHFNESSILDIPIANMDYQQVINMIHVWIKQGGHKYIGVCNVHSTTSAFWTPDLKEALQNSDLNTADGMPLVWMQKLLGYRKASRVYGPTLMMHGLEAASKEGLRVAFYGGHTDRLQILIEKLGKKFPSLQIVEAISPPFRALTKEEDEAYTKRLIDAKPDILWVGLGCPKQESWMLKHRSTIPAVMVGVGAAFDFHAGAVRQAPKHIQNWGLEWAYRLWMEPRRLISRYLTTNPVFLLIASAQLIQKSLSRRNFIHPRTLRSN